nr:B3 domain-containing protein Os07g0563300-like isoform X2 [Tanacetum cinerariifolium]
MDPADGIQTEPHYWPTSISLDRADKELHITEGLKQYMISNNLKAGDTVAFYRLVPDGQYAISFTYAERRNHLL